LKITDNEGNFTYTDNRIVQIEDALFYVGDITPNPIYSGTTSEFTITTSANQYLHIAIYDITGREINVINDGIVSGGLLRFEINSKDLPAGSYSLSVRNTKHTIVKSFNIAK